MTPNYLFVASRTESRWGAVAGFYAFRHRIVGADGQIKEAEMILARETTVTEANATMGGADLKELRRSKGFSQSGLARLAGVGRHAVSYWECKAEVDPRGWAPKRMFAALGFDPLPYFATPVRARGGGVLDLNEWETRQLEALRQREAQRAASARVICGARTRNGQPCRNKSEPGRKRCKFHGGNSTGPKTAQGKARIAEAQRRRWHPTTRDY